jgi:2-dehydropantoate 2-reductase
VTALDKSDVEGDVCVIFTPKSNDTESCVKTLVEVAPPDIPIVSFQNGISNEEIIAGTFENVFGAVCRMTCSLLQPGHVSFRKSGRLIVGKYPRGADAFAKKLVPILADAGFEASVSKSIICDKWLKLVVNLQSGFNAIIDNRDHDTLEFVELKVGVLEEARRVLKTAKQRAKSCDDRDLSIGDVINELKKPKAPRPVTGVRVNNSTWQSLYLKRKKVENSYFHGPIIEMAAEFGIEVPFNDIALRLVTESSDDDLGPGAFRAREVLEEIKKRSGDS